MRPRRSAGRFDIGGLSLIAVVDGAVAAIGFETNRYRPSRLTVGWARTSGYRNISCLWRRAWGLTLAVGFRSMSIAVRPAAPSLYICAVLGASYDAINAVYPAIATRPWAVVTTYLRDAKKKRY